MPATVVRTLLFSTLYPSSSRPNNGIFVETRLRHLVASGRVQSRVVAPVPWFPFAHSRFGRYGLMAQTPHYEHRNGIDVWHPRYVLPPKISTSVAPLLLAIGARSTVARLIAEGGDFDLFDAHYYYPDGAAAAILSRWFGKPFVITARGTDVNVLPNLAIPRRWIAWTRARAAASVFVSHALKARLDETCREGARERVLRNGVDLKFFDRQEPHASRARIGLADGRWILSVGNLVSLKGHDVAVRALTLLPTDIKLVIVGDGDERANLEKLALRLEVSDRLLFAGARPQSELPFWYSAAEALVLCSSREGWPNVLLEAMACGTPVVATAVSGMPEIVAAPTAGRLMSERTAEALARCIVDLMSNPRQPAAVREYAAGFSWDATTEGQIDLFREVLGDRSVPKSRY